MWEATLARKKRGGCRFEVPRSLSLGYVETILRASQRVLPGHSSEVELDCPATYPRSMLCLVRGVGDIGSAVAHLVFREGYAVVLHDEPAPTTTRRGMAFAAEEP